MVEKSTVGILMLDDEPFMLKLIGRLLLNRCQPFTLPLKVRAQPFTLPFKGRAGVGMG